MQIAVKVDVDTKIGLASGCPKLLKIFKGAGISTSFFIPMGPDRTGRTITRIFKNPGILEKAKRTNILEIYGFPTLLYGTLLPSPSVTAGSEDILLRIRDEGHEIGVHGYDHFRWQDHIDHMDERSIEDELEMASAAFKKIFIREPVSFAAPGWRCNEKASRLIDEKHLLYTSNTRGRSPYFPDFNGWQSRTLEIPTTLPTLDELYIPKSEESIVGTIDTYMGSLKNVGLNVYTLHAEIEGRICQDFLRRFIEALKMRGAAFIKLEDLAKEALSRREAIGKARVVNSKVAGRAGFVACQS